MARTFGYVRGSTDRQTLTVEAQRARITAYAVTRDLGEVIFFADPGVSAAKVPFGDREAGSALVATLRPGDHVIVTNIDRAFRNLVDCLRWFEVWIERDIFLHVVNFNGNTIDPRTAIGKLVFRTIASIAEFESELRGERVAEVARHLKRAGRHVSGSPRMGFKVVKDGGRGVGKSVRDAKTRAVMAHVLETVDREPSMLAACIALTRDKTRMPMQQKSWNTRYVALVARTERQLRAEEQGEAS